MPALLEHKPSTIAVSEFPDEPDQGVIKEARRRQRARRMRTALGGLLAAGGIAGVALALGASGRPPTSPASSRPLSRGAAAHGGATTSPAFNVRLSPALDGGQYGWCVAVEETPGAIAGGGCGMTPTTSTPLAMQLSNASLKTHIESIVVIGAPQMAAVLVGGDRHVPTVALPGLPYGLRAARILLPLKIQTGRRGRLGFSPPREPAIVALDARGRPLRAGTAGTRLQWPDTAGRGPCSLHAGGLPGLSARWSHVANAIRPFPGGELVGHAFFSCIDTEYLLNRWPLDAAILLDGAHPGTAPAAIPGLTPVLGRRGYFNGPGDFKGELTATRLHNAWLVVAGGRNLAQRIEVLRHLTPTVSL